MTRRSYPSRSFWDLDRFLRLSPPCRRLVGFTIGIAPLLVGPLTARAWVAHSDWQQGEVLVKFVGGPLGPLAEKGNAVVGGDVLRHFPACGWQHVQLPRGMSVPEGLATYEALPGVLAVEPNYFLYPCEGTDTPPNDPYFPTQWALARIAATNAWTLTTGSEEVVVAVIDTGVLYTHEDLAANMWRNPGETGQDPQGNDRASNGLDDDDNGYVDDVYGIDTFNRHSDPLESPLDDHGTHVAGIIAAVGNNEIGTTGINWNARIMALKWLDGDRGGLSGVLECFEYVIQMKRRGVDIRVTNNSYTAGQGPQTMTALKDAMDLAATLGILHVCAASNESADNDVVRMYPASFDSASIISVAASNAEDNRWTANNETGSNYGRNTVDLAAPGHQIRTPSAAGNYGGFTATSAATPHVSGAVALLAALDPSLSALQIKAAILDTVDVLPAWTDLVLTGGRLNLGRAALELVAPDAPPVVLSTQPVGRGINRTGILSLTFSQTMDTASVEAAFRLTPAVEGDFEWSNLNRTLTFRPLNPWPLETRFHASVSGTAQGADGQTLDGNCNRISEGARDDIYRWDFATSPANDNFVDAAVLEGSSGAIVVDNTLATREAGEPDHAGAFGMASLWWRWTPSENQNVSFDSMGSDFETVQAIYTGNTLTDLTPIAGGYVNGTFSDGRVSFAAQAGTTYFIAVAVRGVQWDWGLNDLSHSLHVNWYPAPLPEIHGLGKTAAMIGEEITLTGIHFSGALSVEFNGAEAAFRHGRIEDEYILATVPPGATTGPITVTTPIGTAVSETIFTVVIPEPLPPTTLALQGNARVVIQWPVTAGSAVLEVADNLDSPDWQTTEDRPQLTDDTYSLTVDIAPGARYFRLRHDP